MLLIDNTMRNVPIARITVDTPYLSGEVDILCILDMIYDLIIGYVAGARSANDPDLSWQEACTVTTRSQAKKEGRHKPLKVASSPNSAIVNRNKVLRL